MSKPRDSGKKILAPAAAARWAAAFQKNGKRLVFTNGCFDLLHRGHVTYLEQARRLGDGLIVALNSDASTRRLKGPGRPLVKLQDRARVIAALESVDAVTWFGDSTPVKIVGRLKPRLYVKGGDYDVKTIPEYPVVRSYGGKALALRFVKGRSTTKLIEKAKRR